MVSVMVIRHPHVFKQPSSILPCFQDAGNIVFNVYWEGAVSRSFWTLVYTALCSNIYKGASAYSKLFLALSFLYLWCPHSFSQFSSWRLSTWSHRKGNMCAPDGCNIFQTKTKQNKPIKKKNLPECLYPGDGKLLRHLSCCPSKEIHTLLNECPLWAGISCVDSYSLWLALLTQNLWS